ETLNAARTVLAANLEGASARTQARVMFRSAYELLASGDRDGFEATFRKIASLTSRTPDAGVQLYPLFGDSVNAMLDGDLEGAIDIANQIAQRGEELGSAVMGRLNAEWFQFRPLLLLGRGERILEEQAVPPVYRQVRDALAHAYLGHVEEA